MASKFASQPSQMVSLIGREEMARPFSAFDLAEAASELPTLACAAALI
jgi:hypothetical protein